MAVKLFSTLSRTALVLGVGLAAPVPRAAAEARTSACEAADAAHPVRQAIAAQYERIADALKREDMDALVGLYSAGVGAVTPRAVYGGKVWGRDEALAYQRNMLAAVEKTLHIDNVILHLKVCGDRATATVLQRWYRNQRMDGTVRRIETNALQDEEWSLEPGGWKRGMIRGVLEGVAFVEGRRFNPAAAAGGFDPEAPEYDPDDPHPKRPAVEALLPIATEKGAAAAIAAYEGLKGSAEFYVSEKQVNSLGYRLLELKRAADAVAIFEFNARLYPRSSNAQDSLGEALLAAGDKPRAIAAYRRALQLNPASDNARGVLARLAADRRSR